MSRSQSVRLPWVVPVAVLILALVPRVPRALQAYHPSNDAAEYALLARSLAEGRGFVLPMRVRFFAPDAPEVHEAYGERAPLWPLLLSLPTRWTTTPGWPDPRLQLVNVGLAALAALLVCLLAADLARRRGLRGRSLAWVAFLAGLSAAWLPSLIRASVHLWAEPLGLVLVLASFRHWLALGGAEGADAGTAASAPPWSRLLALGLLAGLARYARPEAWVLVPLFLGLELRAGRRRNALALAAVFFAVNAAGIASTGVLAPQLELFEVRRYEDFMTPGAAAATPTVGQALGGVLGNLVDQVKFMLTPRRAFLLLPLAAVGLGSRLNRPFLLAALAFVLATAAVWSTSDPSRFTIAPLCLLAPVAALEADLWRKRLLGGNRSVVVLLLVAWVGTFAHLAAKEGGKRTGAASVRATGPWAQGLLGVRRPTGGAPDQR